MRWVLGEQSAKQLRGDLMAAVIFAGNNRRRPLGMAEVTLTFDNADGALATPFAEVSVTRRVYRNGEGEYFLNRTQVRLKDIMDLLLGTGLGPDAAAIISQGQIDAILSAKPEARREVFEEVAGTSRYQARKREAQRRLEQTDQNALRVNDVLQELERQAPAVERQVRRARRYRKLTKAARDLEIFSFVRKTANRRDERTRIAAELGVEETDRAGAGSKREQLEADVNRVRYEEYQATLALDDRTSARNAAATAVQDVATAQAGAQARLEEAGRRCEQSERDVDRAARDIADAEARVTALVDQLAAARADRDRGLRGCESAAQAERAASTAWERAYASLRGVEDQRAHAAAKAAEHDSDAHAAQAVRDRAAQTVARFDEELAATRERALSEKRRTATLEAEIASLEREFARQATALAECERARGVAQQRLDAARTELERRRSLVVEASARIDALVDVDSGEMGASPGLAAVRSGAHAGTLSGIVGVVAECIEAAHAHAVAIDVALGPHAQDVVVRTTGDAKQAIALLKRAGAGRATFIALDSLKPEPDSASPKLGAIGPALSLVKARPEARAAVEYLLKNVVVVDVLDTAIRLAAQSPQFTFVTLEGELVRGAAITGGGLDSGPLARRAAIEELKAGVVKLQSDAATAQANLDAARAAQGEAASEFDRAAAARVDAQLRCKDAAGALERVGAELDALTRQAQALEGQREAARAELDRAATSAGDLAEHARAAKTAVEALETGRTRAARESDRLHAELSQLRERHRELAAETAALVERVAQIGDDAEQSRAAVAARRADHEAKIDALAGARAERERCATELEQSVRRRAEVDRGLATVESDAESARQKRDELAARVRDLEERLTEAQNSERERSSELERRRIRLAEIDAEMSVLQETFQQNPATPLEMDDVSARFADYQGDADAEIRAARQELERMGDVNLNALEDQAALVERRDFLRSQLRDLEAARASILQVIAEIDAESVRQFNAVFEKVSAAFTQTFARLFDGGVGKLWLTESDDPLEAGVEIAAQPPGKKMQSLHALSGGERALTAVALIFAILQVRPSPFYVFDEIDAALDEANIGRFGGLLMELAHRAQIIIITHNKATMTLADRIYGVTMGEPGVSSVLSLALEQVGA